MIRIYSLINWGSIQIQPLRGCVHRIILSTFHVVFFKLNPLGFYQSEEKQPSTNRRFLDV